jgi:TRAP-type C4-dicarboxylate transport system substrate-binding protein
MSTPPSTDQQLFSIIPKLNDNQKKALLSVANTFMEPSEDWWDEISDEQKKAIDQALLDVENGKVTEHNVVMARYR